MSELKSIEIKQRCAATTKRRGLNRRCLHTTLRGMYCHQHLKQIEHLRIMKSELPEAKLGLFTTEDIPKGAVIAQYTGEEVVEADPDYNNPYSLQIKSRPPTYIDARKTNTGEARFANDARNSDNNARLIYDKKKKKAYLKANRDIHAWEEILTSYGDDYWHTPYIPNIKKLRQRRPKERDEYENEDGDNFIADEDEEPRQKAKPKKKLVRPADVEEEPMPIPWADPIEEAPWSNSEGEEYLPPTKKKVSKPKASKPKSKGEKHSARLNRSLVKLLKELVAMDEILKEKKLPGADVPKQGKMSDDAYEAVLMKISMKTENALMKHLKTTRPKVRAMVADLTEV